MLKENIIKGCIFDLDGVIVDTAKYHYLAWKRLAKELGFDFTIDDNERLKGVSRMDSLEILLEIGKLQFDETTKLNLATKKNNWYIEYISQMTPDEILPDADVFIRNIKQRNIKTALGSASKNTSIILERLNINDYFDVIVDGNKVSRTKPDPEVFEKAAQELGIHPENCLVFEDAEAGIEAAIRANMKCVGIGSPQILYKANLVISGFSNISFDYILKNL